MSIHEIYLRRKNKVFFTNMTDNNSIRNENLYPVLTMLHNVNTLGYTFSPEVLNELMTLADFQLEYGYVSIIEALKELVGAHKEFVPMYPNFPKQVMNASDAELYVNAMMHYLGDWVGLRIMPDYVKKERKPLKGDVTYKVIDLGTREDFKSIFQNLMSSNTSISQTDKDDLDWLLDLFKIDFEELKGYLPSEFNNKEVMAFVSSKLLQHMEEKTSMTLVRSYVKTATDVLRIAVALSDGDVSLAKPCKFRNFKRRERRLILGLLDGLNQDGAFEDMSRWVERWKRLAHKLHPSEYGSLYPDATQLLMYLCNGERVQNFYSRLEEAYELCDYPAVVGMLSTRAGEFARNLDRLLREVSYNDSDGDNVDAISVVTEFKKVAGQVATPVLLQVMTHFKNRDTEKDFRVFLPKGQLAKVYGVEQKLPKLSALICASVVSVCEDALRERFSKLPSLGNVYLDERLKGYVVPFSQRSASKALKTVSRGSRIKLEDGKNTVRFFIWWKDIKSASYNSRVDIDLSATMLDEDYNNLGTVAYYDLKNEIGCHSGDITSAPKGACEFIDVNIKKYKEAYPKSRYLVMHINSYTGQKFSDMPELFAGFMMRTKPQSGEVFDARTVEQKFDVTSETTYTTPLIVDMETREVIWADTALKQTSRINNVNRHLNQSNLMVRSIVEMVKPNLYDLFRLHAEARGTIVNGIEYADTVLASISVDDVLTYGNLQGNQEEDATVAKVVTPYDMDVIMSEYLV